VSVNAAAAAGVRAVRARSSTYDDGLCARARFALYGRLRLRLLRPRRRPRTSSSKRTASDIISWSANAHSDGPREYDNGIITLYILWNYIRHARRRRRERWPRRLWRPSLRRSRKSEYRRRRRRLPPARRQYDRILTYLFYFIFIYFYSSLSGKHPCVER